MKIDSQTQTIVFYIICGVFLSIFVIERFVKLRKSRQPLIKRLITNIAISGASILFSSFTLKPVVKYTIKESGSNNIGLFYLFDIPLVFKVILIFLLMDLSFYWWHRINHLFSFFWRFHKAHHSDPDMDVSTGFRFHFGEVFFSIGFRIIQVLILGVTPFIFFLYEAVFQIAVFFHHSNMRLPLGFERLLSKLFITPRIHGIHHSNIGEEMNSNYSVIFSFWDRIHKTLILNVPQKDIDIGIRGYHNLEDNRILNVIIMPFCHPKETGRLKRNEKIGERLQNVLAE